MEDENESSSSLEEFDQNLNSIAFHGRQKLEEENEEAAGAGGEAGDEEGAWSGGEEARGAEGRLGVSPDQLWEEVGGG